MTSKIVETTLSADLVGGGTFAVGYPAGFSKGSFVGSLKHKLATGSGNVFPSPAYFTLTFGATSVTVNWTSVSPTLPAGTKVLLELDMPGKNSAEVKVPISPIPGNMVRSGLFAINLGAPATADADGYCASQSVAQNASAILNGALVSSGVGVSDVARNIVAGWTTNAVLTFTFKDEHGNTVVEKSAGGSATFTGKKACKRLISVSSDTAITGLTVGTGNVFGLPVYVPSVAAVIAELEDGYNIKPPARVFLPWELEQTELLAPTAEDLVCPVDGFIDTSRAAIQGAVTTGGDLTIEVNTVAVTGLSHTVANSATKGTRYEDRPTAPRSSTTAVAKGDRITVTPASAFDTAGSINGALEIEVTGLQGTFVGGSTAKPTATTGDVRGTYAPRSTPDGTISYELLVRLDDADFYGQAQFAG